MMMNAIAGRSRKMPDAEAYNAEQRRRAKEESTEDDDPITHVDFTRTGLH